MLPGANREPLWPAGVVGAITHCAGFAAAAVAMARDARGLGIDAEWVGRSAPGLAARIATAEERDRRPSELDLDLWLTLTFSAKESVFKALYPATRVFLGFHDVALTFDTGSGRFEAAYTAGSNRMPAPALAGRFGVEAGLVVTGVTWPVAANGALSQPTP